jgi:hypothetical protein
MNYLTKLQIATGLAFSTIPISIITIVIKHMEYYWIPLPICLVALGIIVIPLFQGNKDRTSNLPITLGRFRE